MLPDILGCELEKGIQKLCESGIDLDCILTVDYFSPKVDIIGDDRRIVRVKKKDNRIILTVSNF